MQLYCNYTSPYARKVMLLVKAARLHNIEWVITNPLTSDTLRAVNPLGKVPALKDGDRLLQDSLLICDYLDAQHMAAGGESFFQHGAPAYYDHLSVHALGQGLIDAAVSTVYEQRRTDTQPSAFWLDRWHQAAEHGLRSLQDLALLGTPQQPHIGTLCLIAALGYLDFRLPHWQWRELNPPLADWYQGFVQLPWVAETAPRDAT